MDNKVKVSPVIGCLSKVTRVQRSPLVETEVCYVTVACKVRPLLKRMLFPVDRPGELISAD